MATMDRRRFLRQGAMAGGSLAALGPLAAYYAKSADGAVMAADGYGPLVVARTPLSRQALAGVTIAVPGTLTSAFLALRLYLGRDFQHRVVPFDRILDVVALGGADAGLVIPAGQLTNGTVTRVARRFGFWEDVEVG